MNIDWQRLGIQQPECAELPEVLLSKPELDASMCLQIADRLRQVAACVDRGTEFGADEYHCLETFVHVLQSMHDQTHPTRFTKMVKDLRSRVALGSLGSTACRKLRYNVDWMLRVLMLSDCLRSSAGLAQAVKHALHLVVPPVLLPVFAVVLDDPSAWQPVAGTVSRWRLLLDGAFMCWHRSRNTDSSGEAVRYVMADSSSQRGRTFQLTVIQSIPLLELPRCFRDVVDLTTMWPSAHH